MKKITESDSNYEDLEKMSVSDLLKNINREDKTVPHSIKNQLPQIEKLINVIVFKNEKRRKIVLFRSGNIWKTRYYRCFQSSPTFGVDYGLVNGLMGWWRFCFQESQNLKEDDSHLGWKDLLEYEIDIYDVVIGIAAWNDTIRNWTLKKCQQENITTGIVCNSGSPVADVSDYPVEVVVGPEFITGSTRMKSGTGFRN